MLKKLICGLPLALILAGGFGAAQHASAAPQRASTVASWPLYCSYHPAAFTVQAVQGISIYSPTRLVIYGSCFRQGAFVFVVDGVTGDQVTPGQQFAPASGTMRITYTIPPAPCAHLLVVWVRDIAGNRLLESRVYSPCPPPPPVFTS